MPGAVSDESLSDEEIPMERDLTMNGPPDGDDASSSGKTSRTNSVVTRMGKVGGSGCL
jgi:hypothetical protein